MSERKVHVSIELEGKMHYVGQLWSRCLRGREGASFQYDSEWLSNIERFALEPALELTDGTFHTEVNSTLFGAIGDSSPDRWGRVLMRRASALFARISNQSPRTLTELDYLLGVYDESRQGALRFSETKEGPFLQNSKSIPPLIELPKLLSASEHLIEDKESEEDLRLLLAPGSSLGGARPKASIRDRGGHLAIAKFPRKDDEYSTVLWEAVALHLAKQSGLTVPESRIEIIAKKPVLISRRFDRDFEKRIPFISAMSMIGAKDNEQHSYLEIVDALRQFGAFPEEDMQDLWKRMVFNILISNTDDHLRNHGFIYERQKGWRLSPVYDVNPTPVEIKPRILTTTIDYHEGTASLDLAYSVASAFGLKSSQAKKIASEVGSVIRRWKSVAENFKISSVERDRMSSAFEHQDLKRSLS